MLCHKIGHLTKDCSAKGTESTGREHKKQIHGSQQVKSTSKMKSIRSVPSAKAVESEGKETLLDVLLSTSEEEEGADPAHPS